MIFITRQQINTHGPRDNNGHCMSASCLFDSMGYVLMLVLSIIRQTNSSGLSPDSPLISLGQLFLRPLCDSSMRHAFSINVARLSLTAAFVLVTLSILGGLRSTVFSSLGWLTLSHASHLASMQGFIGYWDACFSASINSNATSIGTFVLRCEHMFPPSTDDFLGGQNAAARWAMPILAICSAISIFMALMFTLCCNKGANFIMTIIACLIQFSSFGLSAAHFLNFSQQMGQNTNLLQMGVSVMSNQFVPGPALYFDAAATILMFVSALMICASPFDVVPVFQAPSMSTAEAGRVFF